MKFIIRHEIEGRIRIHALQQKMSYREADTFLYYLQNLDGVTFAKVYERTADAVICYTGERQKIIDALRKYHYGSVKAPAELLENSGRELNATYQEKLVLKILFRYGRKLFVPYPIRVLNTGIKSMNYLYKGLRLLLRGRIEVPVLDAAAIGISIVRNDIKSASSIMFLLGIGELLEEWTHKKSVDDLARSMSLNVGKVWLQKDDQEILVPYHSVATGDRVVVHMGNVIPFDGIVIGGEAMVNQTSLTGESVPVRKYADSYVYAGGVVEEGELIIAVREEGGSSRYEKILHMIESSEKLKSNLESKASHLADQLVPYTLLGTFLTYLFTGNATKALSVLMVDFSCSLKLAMPISVLSAIREASTYHITVKGGKFLEAVAEADTIVFDKTGTLTKAKPTVAGVIPFCSDTPDELLRIAACIEEHFPHSMAKAVVNAAREKNLEHEEMHTKVNYIVAHGISTLIHNKKTLIGSYHFVFEDEKCTVPEGMEELFRSLPEEYSHLYLAIDNKLAAVICIKDPLRAEAKEVIDLLRKAGIGKIVMMTGDNNKTASAIARQVGVDEYYSEVLPEDKAGFIERERNAGRKVVMVGDGINDSPALSTANAGISVSGGADIAREIADITIEADDLYGIYTLKLISDALMKRIAGNYRFIVGFNACLILLGVGGILQPAASALLHNTSTLAVGLRSTKDLLK